MKRILLVLVALVGSITATREARPGSGFVQLEAVESYTATRTTDEVKRILRAPSPPRLGPAAQVPRTTQVQELRSAVLVARPVASSPRRAQGPPLAG